MNSAADEQLRQAPATHAPSATPESPGANAHRTAKFTVLIANHSFLLRTRLCSLLSTESTIKVVAEAGCALDTLLQFRAHQPDAVVADAQFPDGSGVEVLNQIKISVPQCVAVLLSNSCTPEFRSEFLRRGADQAFHASTEFERAVEFLITTAQVQKSNSLPSPGPQTPPSTKAESIPHVHALQP